MSLPLIYAFTAAGLFCLVLALRPERGGQVTQTVDPLMAEQLQKIRASRPEF